MDNKPSSMCTRLKTKKIVCISLFVLILSCNKKQLYYHGVVIHENKNPLSLIFSKKGYEIRKVKTVWSQGGETVEYAGF